MDEPFGRCILSAALMLLCAFISVCRAAVKEANLSQAEEKAGTDPRVRSFLRLLDNGMRVHSSLHILSTLSLFVLMALWAVPYAGQRIWTVLLIALIMMLPVALLCFIVPERIAQNKADRLILRLRLPLTVICVLLFPLTWVTGLMTRAIAALFGVDARKEEEVTEDDILAMVDSGEEAGTIESDEHDLIENVFDFTDKTAADCMTHRTDVTAIALDDDMDTIRDTIRDSGLSRFPVYNEDIDDVVGILSSRDFLFNLQEDQPKELRALLREAYFVPETVAADVLFRNMQRKKTHIAVVVDEYGGMSGIVTLEDLLEEIVGNIYDEFDKKEEEPVIRLENGSYRADGTVTLETLEEELAVTLPESEDYDTLSGLIFSAFTAIPRDGETPKVDIICTRDGEKPEDGPYTVMHIKVEQIEDHRVAAALLTPETINPDQEE